MIRKLPEHGPDHGDQMTLWWLLGLCGVGLGAWYLIIVIARWILKGCCGDG